jgi:SAM-dependent methyltransferase
MRMLWLFELYPVYRGRRFVDTVAVFSDADAAALYDLLSPWDPARWPSDAFYEDVVMAAGSVLDVGCGTGAMLHRARERGHTGRLAGLDPDRAALARARVRGDVEWVEGSAADMAWAAEFELATMVGHAFQCLVTDEDLRASLARIRAALREGGRFAFETRHPQARAWQEWNRANATSLIDATGRALRVWHEVESVTGDVVAFSKTTAEPGGAVQRVDRTSLRFLDIATLGRFLADAGFEIEAQYGDWLRGPVTVASREIITIARLI